MRTDTVIIGGGLSGLALATKLAKQGRDFQLLEARGRVGGRIKSETVGAASFDLGPAWFWPGQPRIAALTRALGLSHFDQFAEGLLSHEDAEGQVVRGRGYASMQGSYRLKGGLAALTEALAATLPANRLHMGAAVKSLALSEHGLTLTTDAGQQIKARQAVLALPPRVASQLSFAPALPPDAHRAMDSIATWMAGQAKAVAVYDTPFWREAGLSGDAMSRRGPMVEIHDASPDEGGPYALFGFVGLPAQARGDETALRQAVVAQLARMFGPKAAAPKSLFIKDWASDPFTATRLDQQPLHAHPSYGLPSALAGLWQGRLVFSGTEVAPQFGGYLEGALEAADIALAQLTPIKVKTA